MGMDKIIKMIILVIIGAVVAGVLRRHDTGVSVPATDSTSASPTPEPVAPPWIAAVDGNCPQSHPVKLKQSSGIYHVEGQRNYERTIADRCYCDTSAAEADGFRASKV